MNNGCFFIGHRDTPGSARPQIIEAVERHIAEYGVTEFYVGTYGAFDAITARVLTEMKKKHPHIHNYLALAYHPSIRPIELPDGFESSFFPEGQELAPPKLAIIRLNRLMIKESAYLIAYVWMITGGSYKLLEYAAGRAKRGQLIVTNLTQPHKRPK